MSRLLYNRKSTCDSLFWYFQHYFQAAYATVPAMENLFLLVLSMLALDCFHSVHYAWTHIMSRFSDKTLNSYYYTLNHGAFDHLKWAAVTVKLTLSIIPACWKGSAVFLSIDDTLVEKYGAKFQARSKLFDHASHNGSTYMKGHCFVSVVLHVPVATKNGGVLYLSVPLQYRLWTKEETKLELAAKMVRAVMKPLSSCPQVLLLCDSWYPKKPVTGLIEEFKNLELICNVRVDTVLYDLPGERTGKRGRPRVHGEKLTLESFSLEKPEESDYYMGHREVMTNLWKGRRVHAYVTASDPEKHSTFRLFLCTAQPESLRVETGEQASKKIHQYGEWGMLPLGLYGIRWNHEVSYYETKAFWGFRNYRIRSVKGIERLTNLLCISYTATRLLPYYSHDFHEYRGQSAQEVRYHVGEKIRMDIIISSLKRSIETAKINEALRKAFKAFMSSWHYS